MKDGKTLISQNFMGVSWVFQIRTLISGIFRDVWNDCYWGCRPGIHDYTYWANYWGCSKPVCSIHEHWHINIPGVDRRSWHHGIFVSKLVDFAHMLVDVATMFVDIGNVLVDNANMLVGIAHMFVLFLTSPFINLFTCTPKWQ